MIPTAGHLAVMKAASEFFKRKSEDLQYDNETLKKELEDERAVSKRQQLPNSLRAGLRGCLVSRRIQKLREERAALKIQMTFRGYIARKKFVSVKSAVLAIQNHFRGRQARLYVQRMRYEHAVLKSQSFWRGQKIRQRFQADRKKAVQPVRSARSVRSIRWCQVRKWLAKGCLRQLKIEDRSVGHLQKLNTGLENKIIQLQQRLDSVVAEKNELIPLKATVAHLQAQVTEVQSERDQLLKWKNKAVELEQDIKRLETDCDVKEAEKAKLKSQIDQMSYRMDTMGTDHDTALQQMQDQLGLESQKTLDLQLMLQKTENLLSDANTKRIQAEKDVVKMKEQLLANANLLASPAFNREGSIRRDGPTSSGSVTSVHGEDMDDITLIMRQQKSISELRTINDKYTSEIERLRSLGGAKDLILSTLQRINDLEKASQTVRSLLQPVIAHGGVPCVEEVIYENEKLWRKAAVIRARLQVVPQARMQDIFLTDCATRGHEGTRSKMDELIAEMVGQNLEAKRMLQLEIRMKGGQLENSVPWAQKTTYRVARPLMGSGRGAPAAGQK